MSFVLAAPEALVTAASELAGIGSTLGTANAAAAAPITGVAAAAADEVSAQVAAMFSEHGLGYQQLSARVTAFHEQFVQALSAGASTYAAAEANAAQTLVNAVSAPAATLLGQPLLGSGIAGALLAPAAVTNAAVLPAANALVSLGDAIEGAYLTIEPWVQYGFNLAAWAAGYLPVIGFVAPQINFFYYLFEPIVQSALFNTIDFIDGTVSFTQGLSNFWTATTASVNQFINTEINWVRGFLPPLPPIGVNAG